MDVDAPDSLAGEEEVRTDQRAAQYANSKDLL
jgi:hypothetical protein